MMNKLLILAFSIAIIFMMIGLLPVHGEEAVYESVIRLHVLANSDSESDQALKLEVRDAILSYTEELLTDASSREEASDILSAHLTDLKSVAEARLRALGCDAPVTVRFGTERYPTRQYESCTFPSGKYLSLQVCIGEANGQNWWCVLFPSLCLSAASEGGSISTSLATLGLSGDQYRIITDSENATYHVRFKILEVFEELVE